MYNGNEQIIHPYELIRIKLQLYSYGILVFFEDEYKSF